MFALRSGPFDGVTRSSILTILRILSIFVTGVLASNTINHRGGISFLVLGLMPPCRGRSGVVEVADFGKLLVVHQQGSKYMSIRDSNLLKTSHF